MHTEDLGCTGTGGLPTAAGTFMDDPIQGCPIGLLSGRAATGAVAELPGTLEDELTEDVAGRSSRT